MKTVYRESIECLVSILEQHEFVGVLEHIRTWCSTDETWLRCLSWEWAAASRNHASLPAVFCICESAITYTLHVRRNVYKMWCKQPAITSQLCALTSRFVSVFDLGRHHPHWWREWCTLMTSMILFWSQYPSFGFAFVPLTEDLVGPPLNPEK